MLKNLVDILELRKQLDIRQREILVLQEEINRIRNQAVDKNVELNQILFSTSTLIQQIQNPDQEEYNLDRIFVEGEDEGGVQARLTLAGTLSMLKFLYTTDPMSQLSQQELQIVHQETQDWIG